jgi:hypothetical protein
MKVAYVSTFDSFVRANAILARSLENFGFDGDHYIMLVRRDQITSDQIAGILQAEPKAVLTVEATIARLLQEDYDWVILSAENTSCRRFFSTLSKHTSVKRPLVATVYPGILFRHHVDGFSARSPADLVLLNSRKDQLLYRDLIHTMGFETDNSFNFGPVTALGSTKGKRSHSGNKVVFFDQPSVPRTAEEKAYLFRELQTLADRHPELEFCVKLRVNPKQSTLHKGGQNTLHVFEECNSSARGRKLSLIEGSSAEVIAQSILCLSVSSTALIEALAYGCPVVSISDFGLDEEYGGAYFIGSGVTGFISEVDPNHPPEPSSTWLADNIGEPDLKLAELASQMRLMASNHQVDRPAAISVYPAYGSNRFLDFATATFGERRAVERHYRKPERSLAQRFSSYLRRLFHTRCALHGSGNAKATSQREKA